MGGGRPLSQEELHELELAHRRRQQELRDKRTGFAESIALEVSSLITEEVIRPGPKPEERQCTDVANELTLLEPKIALLIRSRLFPDGRRAGIFNE